MRPINKGNEPRDLIKHRKSKYVDYDNYSDKAGLREAMLSEQRGLCCYCMGRIPDKQGQLKIEHWQCIANYPQNQLIYQNLLAACRGGEGLPPKRQHCDTLKADRDLLFNPANPNHRDKLRITYKPSGKIQSDNKEFDRQLNEILNLNLPLMMQNRRRVLRGVMKRWQNNHPVSRKRLEKEISSRLHSSEKLEPYVEVAIWWLKKKLVEISS